MIPAFLLPRSASTLAPKTDALYFALVDISLAIVALVLVLVVVFSVRYRRNSSGGARTSAAAHPA